MLISMVSTMQGLLTKHFGKQAVYKLDVSSLAEARAVYEVS